MVHGIEPEVPAVLILANQDGVRRIPIGAIGVNTMIDLKPALPTDTVNCWYMPRLRHAPNTIPIMLTLGATTYHYGGFWGVVGLVILQQLWHHARTSKRS